MARISVNQGRFAMQPQATIRRSTFDRSFVYKTTFDSGKLIPYFVDEVLPGDTFKLSVTEFCRMTTPIVPIMDNLYFETQFFYVPYRLVWENWVKMCGEQDNPEDSTDFTVPQFMVPVSSERSDQNYGIGFIDDYFGIGTYKYGSSDSILNDEDLGLHVSVSALPFRAYWLIWNEWYRDENLQKSVKIRKSDLSSTLISISQGVVEGMGSGTGNPNYGFPDGVSYCWECAPRGKRYDYFTSCLPWPQKGPGAELPLGDTLTLENSNLYASVDSNYYSSPYVSGQSGSVGSYGSTVPAGLVGTYNSYSTTGYPNYNNTSPSSGNFHFFPSDKELTLSQSSDGSGGDSNSYYNYETFYPTLVNGDLNATVGAVTINSLRQAFMLQRYYEIDARGGTRYTEKLQAHFGVTNPDSRLQRPEYLGGHSSMFNINPVAQTSSSDSTSPQGNLAAFGVHGATYKAFNKSFTEFGVVIGLCSVRADLTYQQGIDRMWSRNDVFDFYWPSFAHLGEQAVLNKEIYAQGTDVDDEVFGYQERYAEYRYKPSKITGMLRSTFIESLDVWHLSQKFDSLPVLGDEFIQDHPPMSRVLAINETADGLKYPEFILDVKFHLKCIRPMPMYSVPGLMPHF